MEMPETEPTATKRQVWNAGRTVGAKRALKPKQIWEIRFYLTQPRRLRGQAQFIERPVMARSDSPIGRLLDQLRGDPAQRWTIGRMARAVAMSEPTLARRFREETGDSPLAWLTVQRIALTREHLETTNLPREHIAERSGIGSATNLRVHFTSNIGIPPNIYRKQFRRAENSPPL